jgi:hypothetical protein
MTDFRAELEHAAQELNLAENALLCSSFHNSVIRVKAAARRGRAALAQPAPQGPMPEVDDILRLAAIIRRVDGNHDKGAAALAEAILRHPDSRWQHAQPEPQGPTDEELWDLYQDLGSYFSPTEFARTVLARWGRPAIEPVPVSERLPGPEDCDKEGCCWWWDYGQDSWSQGMPEYCINRHTHWLPHYALPVPGVEGADG